MQAPTRVRADHKLAIMLAISEGPGGGLASGCPLDQCPAQPELRCVKASSMTDGQFAPAARSRSTSRATSWARCVPALLFARACVCAELSRSLCRVWRHPVVEPVPRRRDAGGLLHHEHPEHRRREAAAASTGRPTHRELNEQLGRINGTDGKGIKLGWDKSETAERGCATSARAPIWAALLAHRSAAARTPSPRG